jgi:hypothetical protein
MADLDLDSKSDLFTSLRDAFRLHLTLGVMCDSILVEIPLTCGIQRPYNVAVLYHYAFKSDGEIHYTNCVRGVHSPHRGQLHCAIVKVITKWRLVRCLMIRHGGNIDIDAHGTKIGCTTMQQTPHCQSKIDTHKRRFSGSKNQKEEHVVHFSNALDLQTLGRCTHWSVLRYIHYLKLGIFWVTK